MKTQVWVAPATWVSFLILQANNEQCKNDFIPWVSLQREEGLIHLSIYPTLPSSNTPRSLGQMRRLIHSPSLIWKLSPGRDGLGRLLPLHGASSWYSLSLTCRFPLRCTKNMMFKVTACILSPISIQGRQELYRIMSCSVAFLFQNFKKLLGMDKATV